MKEECIEVVHDEEEAVIHAVDTMEEGDLVLITVNDVQGILELLRQRGARA